MRLTGPVVRPAFWHARNKRILIDWFICGCYYVAFITSLQQHGKLQKLNKIMFVITYILSSSQKATVLSSLELAAR